jgi:hypothetical protein
LKTNHYHVPTGANFLSVALRSSLLQRWHPDDVITEMKIQPSNIGIHAIQVAFAFFLLLNCWPVPITQHRTHQTNPRWTYIASNAIIHFEDFVVAVAGNFM